MAHELMTYKNAAGQTVNCFAYHGDTPWHKLGQRVVGAMTSEQAVTEANLGWRVGLAPLFVQDQDRFEKVPETFAVRRDDGFVLGTVGKRYQPIQNTEVFDFMDTLVEGGALRYHTAGAIRDGRKVFLLAKVTDDPLHVVPGDKIDQYVLAMNSHDGSGSMQVLFTTVRVVCQNTLNLAISNNSKFNKGAVVHIKHMGKLETKKDTARKILGIAKERMSAFEKAARALAAVPMDPPSFRQFTTTLVPDGKNEGEQNKVWVTRQLLQDNFERGPGTEIYGVKNTRWAALNAVTDMTTHSHGANTSAGTRFMTTMLNQGNDMAQRAYNMLLAA